MDTDEFLQLQTILAAGPEADDGICRPGDFRTACYRRLLIALSDTRASALDRAVLLRHALRHESEVQQGIEQSVRVVTSDHRFEGVEWGDVGVRAMPTRSGATILKAELWRPEWLEGGSHAPARAAFAEEQRRHDQPVPGDPFLAGFQPLLGGDVASAYLTLGQKQAVRAALATPPGATLLVNLPTGSGKSLCAHVLARLPFQGSTKRGLTVVAVPTVALALDQEKALAGMIPHPTAYCGGGGESNAERNREIRRRIRNGEQRIIFTSPEALLQSLRPSLYVAAQRGLLQALVIDEAHIVDQWGDDFRPAFQALAGLRAGLLKECQGEAFRTLLQSATITRATLETLVGLFGSPGPFRMVAAVQLRPEPTYWVSQCVSRDEKFRRVEEALCHLPRPAIVYVTMRSDAKALFDRMRAVGYRRVHWMTGETENRQRQRIIEDWAADRVDVVVATSAFGLGVDKSNVRSVVHACAPEGLDRLYQEVGRTGRDGLASVSITLYTSRDLKTARGLAGKRMIGCERGRQRWEAMFHGKVAALGDDRFRLRLDVPPSHDPDDIDMSNEESTRWNARTLNLMMRAGLIALEDEPPPVWADEEDSEDGAQDLSDEEPDRETRTVRVLHADHLSRECWDRDVEPVRHALGEAAREQNTLLRRALEGDGCIADVLAASYTLPAIEENGNVGACVARSCGGCAYCRERRRDAYSFSALPTPWPWGTFAPLGHELESMMLGTNLLAVVLRGTTDVRQARRQVGRVANWLAEQGINYLLADDDVVNGAMSEGATLVDRAVFRDDPSKPLLRRPCTAVAAFALDPRAERWLRDWLVEHMARRTKSSPAVLVVPDDLGDPSAKHRLLHEVISCRKVDEYELEVRHII